METRRTLSNGEILIKTEEGIYFLALNENSMPLLIDQEEGIILEEEYEMNIELIAKICHNVNKAYCESIGDFSQPTWNDAPEWQRSSAINGVKFHMENDVTPEQSHENWLKQKLAEGWVYGKEKDPELKTHPCIKRYDELPKYQRAKDALFKSVCDSFKG